MEAVELKLKQASVVLDISPKDLQNLVQFRVIKPKRRGGLNWFDWTALLQAKVALYLRQTLEPSTASLVRLTLAVSSELRTGADVVRIMSRTAAGRRPLEIVLPVGSFASELEERLPLANLYRDLPRGRKRRGWRQEFLEAVREAATDLGTISEKDLLKTIRDYRKIRRARPEITVVAETSGPPR